jgi:hypothetical protein
MMSRSMTASRTEGAETMEQSKRPRSQSWPKKSDRGHTKHYDRQQGERTKPAEPREPKPGQSWADIQDQKFKQPRVEPKPREPGPGQSWADFQDQKFKQPQLTLDLNGPVGWRARQAAANDHAYRKALAKFVAQQPGLQVSKDDVREQRHGILTKEYKDARLKPFDDRPQINEKDRARSRGFGRD